MNLQVIRSRDGKPEFVLLPIDIYEKCSDKLKAELMADQDKNKDADYLPFVLEDYVENPVALARMKAHVTQGALAEAMEVSQAYISKLENQKSVTPKMLARVNKALKGVRN